MGDNLKIVLIYAILFIAVFFVAIHCEAQTIVNDKDFNKTKSGISIVEFWADWNKKNECNWITDILNAKSFRIDLDSQAALEHNITVLPTVIVFNNGKEIKRFEGNIGFKLCPKRTPKKIQKEIDKLDKKL